MARVKINKNGEIRISNDIKLSQEQSDFISHIAEVTDESWQDVLDYIEAYHMITRLRNLDEELVQEIRGRILLESCGQE